MNVCINYKYKNKIYYDRIDVPEGIDVNKTNALKSVMFFTIGIC